MKQLLSVLAFLAFGSLAYAASPDVHIAVTDFTLAITPGSRTVTLAPVSAGTVRSGTSDSAGDLTLGSVFPGDYTLSISGSDIALTLHVPSSYARFEARDLVVGAWTRPTAAGSSQAASNLREWSLLSPSSKQDALGATSEITISNATINGSLLGVADGALQLDGSPITGGGASISNITSTGEIFGFGSGAVDGSTITDAFDIFAYGDNAMNGAQLSGISEAFAFGYSAMGSATVTNSFDIYAIGSYAANNSDLANTGDLLAFGYSALKNSIIRGGTDIYGFGTDALNGSHLTNSVDVYAMGTGAGANVTGSITNVILIGKSATASSGDANLVIFGPGMSLRVKGQTGITTTNTFYSVDAGLTSTVTNVVVIQGGIITSWTVTP